jgi:hypothetical protein
MPDARCRCPIPDAAWRMPDAPFPTPARALFAPGMTCRDKSFRSFRIAVAKMRKLLANLGVRFADFESLVATSHFRISEGLTLRVGSRVAPDVESRVAPDVESRVAPDVESRVAPDVESRVAPDVESRVGSRVPLRGVRVVFARRLGGEVLSWVAKGRTVQSGSTLKSVASPVEVPGAVALSSTVPRVFSPVAASQVFSLAKRRA